MAWPILLHGGDIAVNADGSIVQFTSEDVDCLPNSWSIPLDGFTTKSGYRCCADCTCFDGYTLYLARQSTCVWEGTATADCYNQSCFSVGIPCTLSLLPQLSGANEGDWKITLTIGSGGAASIYEGYVSACDEIDEEVTLTKTSGTTIGDCLTPSSVKVTPTDTYTAWTDPSFPQGINIFGSCGAIAPGSVTVNWSGNTGGRNCYCPDFDGTYSLTGPVCGGQIYIEGGWRPTIAYSYTFASPLCTIDSMTVHFYLKCGDPPTAGVRWRAYGTAGQYLTGPWQNLGTAPLGAHGSVSGTVGTAYGWLSGHEPCYSWVYAPKATVSYSW